MKYSILIFLFLFAFQSQAQQSVDIKVIDGINYKIDLDTSSYGVITKVMIPISNVADELNSSINSIDGQLINIDAVIAEQERLKKLLQLKRKQLVAQKTKLGL